MTPITHIVSPFIPMINPLTKSHDPPSRPVEASTWEFVQRMPYLIPSRDPVSVKAQCFSERYTLHKSFRSIKYAYFGCTDQRLGAGGACTAKFLAFG